MFLTPMLLNAWAQGQTTGCRGGLSAGASSKKPLWAHKDETPTARPFPPRGSL